MDMYGLSFELSGLTLRIRTLQSRTYSCRGLVSAEAEPHVIIDGKSVHSPGLTHARDFPDELLVREPNGLTYRHW